MKKKIIPILILILFVFGAYLFLSGLNGGGGIQDKVKEEAYVRLLGRKPVFTEDAKGEAEFKGKYVYFKYPARAKIYTYKDPSQEKLKLNLETLSFDIEKPRLIFNFSVSENFGNIKSLSDYSAVILRKDPSRGYAESKITVDKQEGWVYGKGGSQAEKTAFFLVNNRIYSFAISGSDSEAVSELLDEIMKSLLFLN